MKLQSSSRKRATPQNIVKYNEIRNTLMRSSHKESPRINQQQLHDDLLKISKPAQPHSASSHQTNNYFRADFALSKDYTFMNKANQPVATENQVYTFNRNSQHNQNSVSNPGIYQMQSKKDKKPISMEQTGKYTNYYKTKESQTFRYSNNALQNDQTVPPYTFKHKNRKMKIASPTYNFFSFLDEPINNLMRGLKCTCPKNEIIASKINEIEWTVEQRQ